jgi:hypothetical protein
VSSTLHVRERVRVAVAESLCEGVSTETTGSAGASRSQPFSPLQYKERGLVGGLYAFIKSENLFPHYTLVVAAAFIPPPVGYIVIVGSCSDPRE